MEPADNRLAQLLHLLRQDPDEPFLLFAIAKEEEKRSDDIAAATYYQRLVDEHPDYLATYYHFGKCLERQNRLTEAASIFKKGLDVAELQKDLHTRGELQSALDLLED